MNKMNIEDCYFHGLAGSVPFWKTEEIIEFSLFQLSSIIKTGGIYSRKELKNNFGIEYADKQPLFNGKDYISVCIRNTIEEEYNGDFYDSDSAFFKYIKYKIGIVIDPLKVSSSLRTDLYRRFPGERQINGHIDLSSVKAIIIGLTINYADNLIGKIKDILGNYNIPIIDINGNILSLESIDKVYTKSN